MANKKSAKLRVTLVRSPSGKLGNHRDTVRGLGLRRMHHSVEVQDTPEIRGMVNKVNYLVQVEEL
jgi:large subunit ribosomal protein L30